MPGSPRGAGRTAGIRQLVAARGVPGRFASWREGQGPHGPVDGLVKEVIGLDS